LVFSRGLTATAVSQQPPSPPPPPPAPALARTRATKVRDPDAPKRPASSWLRFLAQFRKDRPDLKHKEVMTAAAADWKGLSPAAKAPFESAYRAEKAQYDCDLQGHVDLSKPDPEKPKKPPTAYLLFAAEVRSQNPSLKMTEQSKLAGKRWKAMIAGEKEPYERRAAPDVERYKEQMKAYKDSGKEAAWKQRVASAKAAAKAKAKPKAKAKAKAKASGRRSEGNASNDGQSEAKR